MKPLLLLLPLLVLPALAFAAEDELEQLLQGFDDVPEMSVQDTQDELDESGFDSPGSAPVTGQNALSDLDESGFDDPPLTGGASTVVADPVWYTLSGYTSVLGAYNYAQRDSSVVAPGDQSMDFSGLSRARIKGGLTLEMKHGELNGHAWQSRVELVGWYDGSWAINGREDYTEDVVDAYETFVDIKDAYIQGSLTDQLDLKFGRQIVIWGKSDSIRVTDIINPLDNREPGMVDIEDLRLNELMTRLDYYVGNWGLSAMVIHEPRQEIEAPFGSDYRPSNIFGSPIPYSKFPDRQDLDWNAENTQYALSLDGRFSGWDLSLYAADVFDNRFDVETIGGEPERYNDKVGMLGVAGNVVSGSWLLKAEAAYFNDVNYRSTDRKSRLDMLVGIEYNGIRNTVMSVELADRHIFDYEAQMLTLSLQDAADQGTLPDFVREDSVQMAFRSSYSFDHDNATASYLISLSGGNGPGSRFDGGFQRLWIDYKYSDAIALSAGIVDYIGGDSLIPFYEAIKDNDRVYVELRYSF